MVGGAAFGAAWIAAFTSRSVSTFGGFVVTIVAVNFVPLRRSVNGTGWPSTVILTPRLVMSDSENILLPSAVLTRTELPTTWRTSPFLTSVI